MQHDTDELFKKLARGSVLSVTEVEACMQTLGKRLAVLQKEDPERYILLVEELASLYEAFAPEV